MSHHELTFLNALAVEDELKRIDEACHQHTAGTQHPIGFSPHWKHALREDVGYGVEHQVEAGVRKHRQVSHVALHGA